MIAESLECLQSHLTRYWKENRKQLDGLTLNEFSYLRAIKHLDGGQVAKDQSDHGHGPHFSDLADLMGVNRASASTMLRKLEKQGLVTFYDCQYDSRAQHIVLTAEGEHTLARGKAVYQQVARDLMGGLGREEAEQLGQLLNRVCAKL